MFDRGMDQWVWDIIWIAIVMVQICIISIYQQKNMRADQDKTQVLNKPIIVFDIDGTLLHRTRQPVQGIKYSFKSNGQFIYIRPNLFHLSYNFNRLATKSTIVLWTSMLRKNAIKIQEHLNDLGMPFDRLYTQQNCQPNLAKDLRVVAKDYKVDVGNIYLIDDSPHKRVGNQNMLIIKEYICNDPNDNQILRIVKQLYQLLDIEFEEKFIEEAENYQLCNRFNKVKINYDAEEKLDKQEKKEKKENNQKQEKKEKNEKKEINGYRQRQVKKFKEKGNNVNRGKKYQEKTIHNKHEKLEEVNPIKYKQKPFSADTKVIIFDLNKTIIMKQKQPSPILQPLLNPSKIQNNIIYNRPFLNILQHLISIHAQIDIKFLVWSTMTGKSSIIGCHQVVNNLPVKFIDVVNGVQKKQGHQVAKDLTVICDKYGGVIDNMMLVDDSWYKNVEGQNFVHVCPFDGNLEDKEMVRVAMKIDQFIKCSDENCEIKKLYKKYEEQFILTQKLLNQTRQKQKIQTIQTQKLTPNHHNLQNPQPKQKTAPQPQQKLPKITLQLQHPTKIKCIVFDINETLLFRSHKKIHGIQHDAHFNHFFYLRPYLEDLINFILQFHQLFVVCLWSTITARNCEVIVNMLVERGFVFRQVFYGEQLVLHKKDLKLVADTVGVDLENIVLVDDNPKKRVKGQNFIQIEAYDPQNKQDDALLELIKQLSKHIESKETKTEEKQKQQ